MPPFFTLAGHPQTTNENNKFALMVVEAFEMAAMKYGNAVLFNESTDGVACEVQFNKTLTLSYLDVGKKCLSMPDSNHNSKKFRAQMVSVKSAVSIRNFVVDPWMLKMANVVKELDHIEDWASNATVLHLASSKTVSKLLGCNFNNFGNCASLILSLTFIRIRSFSINARELRCQDGCVYQWATFLWFSSFNTPMITMLTKNRNMCLETIGSLFLFPRIRVSEGRRLTSDPNEHSNGMWRMILREFNMEQLIRIVQKNNLRMECIFENDIVVSRSNTTFKGYLSTLSDFNESLKRGSSTSGPVSHDCFSLDAHL